MAVEKISVERFVELSQQFPVIDVRSEAEFQHAHVPGAYNLPLFNNDERKVVGTIYKQQSREMAIKKGLEYFGPKMKEMIVFAEKINNKLNNKTRHLSSIAGEAACAVRVLPGCWIRMDSKYIHWSEATKPFATGF